MPNLHASPAPPAPTLPPPPFTPRPRPAAREKLHPSMTFREAFSLWIERRTMHHLTLISNAQYLSERTEWDYRQYARALDKSFASTRLQDIDADALERYQYDRAFCQGAWAKQAGATRIRKELGMLTRIMREARCWTEENEQDFVRVRPVETDICRALSPEEQQRLLQVAGSKAEWVLIYAYTVAAIQTSMSTNELRSLLVSDVSLSQGIVQVRRGGAKNRYRIRTIPIETRECRWAFETLVSRAVQLGGGRPHHYLFPFGLCGGQSYDHTRPMSNSGLKKRWDDVRIAAEMPELRLYDLRHTAITRMAESGVSISTILAFAGHMSVKMQQHYTAISMTAKRKATAAVWSENVPLPTYDTSPSAASRRSPMARNATFTPGARPKTSNPPQGFHST